MVRTRSRPLICSALLFALSLPSSAPARIRPGLEVGMNGSSLRYSEEMPWWGKQDLRYAFTGGATVEIPVASQFAVLTGLRYVRLGNRVEVDATGRTGEFRLTQDYLAVPTLLEFRPPAPRGLFVALGPELAVLISGHADDEFYIARFLEWDTSHEDITRYLRATNLTLDAGIGWEFPLQDHVGTVTARYAHGLFDVAKESDWATNWKTRSVDVLLGVRW